MLNTVRVLISIATNLDWLLYQLDVKNVLEWSFGRINLHIHQDSSPKILPIRYVDWRNLSMVWSNPPRAWFHRFTKVFQENGYMQCQLDHTMYVKHIDNDMIYVIIVYVDNIVITGNHEEKISQIKQLLSKEFEMKNLGHLKYFLGMEVVRSKHGICISERKYVLDLLKETCMLGCNSVDTLWTKI